MKFTGKTALIIAVFLMFGLNGCYTKFAHRGLMDMPDQPAAAEADSEQWDFGFGWYRPVYQEYGAYHDYYYGQWWDNCPRLQDADSTNQGMDYDEQNGKIARRDYYNFPAGVIIEPPMAGVVPDPNGKPPASPGISQPITKDNNDNANSDNSQKSDSAKLKRRGGR